jgi:signal transduction histidine kinase
MPDTRAVPPSPDLPFASHPGVLTRLLGELAGARVVGDEAARLFLLDPALALLALQALAHTQPGVNLAGMRLRARIATLDTTTLKSRVVALAAQQLTHPAASAENLETYWRKALATAAFCRALALRSNYPGEDEAWLAGLMCWLPRFARPAESGAAQAALDALALDSFIADAPRYLDTPAQRLVDAAPLVRLAIAAHRQTMNFPAWIPALPHADALLLAAPLDGEAMREIHLAMAREVDRIAADIGPYPLAEIAHDLGRMARLELLATCAARDQDSAIVRLADDLAGEDGLGHAIYLRMNVADGTLRAQPLRAEPAPPLYLKPEGSTAAAAWALLTRAPVVVTLDAPADAAVLDLQLIRQAGAEGLAAIPIGAGDPVGVLLVRGGRAALARVTAHPHHYRRLGEIVLPPAGAARIAAAHEGESALAGRVRRATHEISNPLGVVKNYLAILRAKLGDDAPIADELRIMREELDRIVRILRNLATGGTEADQGGAECDVNALVEDLIKATEATWRSKGLRVETRLAPDLPKLARDADKLKQILLNLQLNAQEATPAGGLIRWETCLLTDHQQARQLQITVSDTGPGIPAEVRPRLFTPIESTKGDGHAGLGLSIVKSLTQALSGTIRWRSDAGGTMFDVTLPL